MALLLCVGLCPAWAFAEESVSGPCAHHTEHTNMAGAEVPVEVTVTPNPLTEEMVTLSETAVVYDGYEHKPVVTVDGMDEGTDYEITYSSQDFTNAGTVVITVTGKGNYAGTVEKTFTIEKATLTVRGTCIAKGTYGVKLSELTVEGDWTVRSESGAGVPGWWMLTGDAIPNVGDSGKYTATFTPVSGAENYYPLTAPVTLDINPADQAAPAAPTATEENIRDNSITLTAVENGEYSLDGTTWQDSPTFTGLSPNVPYTFHIRLKADKNHNASPSSTASITTNSGGNEDNGGQGNGGGGSTDSGSGNTQPQIPVLSPADTNTGIGTALINPGSGNTSRSGTGSGSSAGTPTQGTKQPFVKGEDGKTGWDVIRVEEEQAEEGSTINVDMNGSVAVPRDIFDRIKGKDITVTFDMGSGILWSVDGKSVTGNTSPDSAGDIDFSVKTGVDTVPVDIVNNVTGERYSIQISLAFEGEFGFTAVLSINLGRENAGYTASLYYYNENTGELEFICADEVSADGTAFLAFTHASDYVIAIDGDGEEGDSAVESAQPDEKGGTAGNGTMTDKNPQEGQPWGMWLAVVIGVGAGVFFIARKKKDGESE